MKTKAFSKMGLGQATKLDPKEKARNEMRDWINDTVTTLGTEVRGGPASADAPFPPGLHRTEHPGSSQPLALVHWGSCNFQTHTCLMQCCAALLLQAVAQGLPQAGLGQ